MRWFSVINAIMKKPKININRRKILFGLSATSLIVPIKAFAQSGAFFNAGERGLKPNISQDQSALFQKLIDEALILGLQIFVPAGNYFISNIKLPSNISISGIFGATTFIPLKNEVVFSANGAKNISIKNITINGVGIVKQNLIHFFNCNNIMFEKISLTDGLAGGFFLEKCQGAISFCNISKIKNAAIHIQDSASMFVSSNKITDCKNGGILVWRYESARDGSIITNNQISGIGSESGSGQNGNGINLYQADEVIIADNSIADCAFSAIRVNSTKDTIINGNICTQCQEVAIFSEFAFSGSIISDNLIDEASLGISVSNFDYGGRLAIVSGNIVRNIWKFSPTNPDVRATGIYAEADTAIYSNVIENVPGFGIVAGWGPYLRDMLVSQNIVRNTKIAIAVSVVDGVGSAHITGNLISSTSTAIQGMEWTKNIGSDLAINPEQFPVHTIAGNFVS